jgi:hypothetical protein
MSEELFKIELTSSQLKVLYNALNYAGTFYASRSYLVPEMLKMVDLVDALKAQTIEGEQI